MNPELFYQVVVPLLGVKNTALLAISTPQDEFNYYTELMALENAHGEPLFLCIKIGLMCKRCQEEGLVCNHRLSMSPHWKPPERTAKVDAVMASNPTLRDRETRGVVSSTMRFLIDKLIIQEFQKREPGVFADGRPNVLFSAIDPSGGGSGSDYAIVTMAMNGGIPTVSAHYVASEQSSAPFGG